VTPKRGGEREKRRKELERGFASLLALFYSTIGGKREGKGEGKKGGAGGPLRPVVWSRPGLFRLLNAEGEKKRKGGIRDWEGEGLHQVSALQELTNGN